DSFAVTRANSHSTWSQTLDLPEHGILVAATRPTRTGWRITSGLDEINVMKNGVGDDMPDYGLGFSLDTAATLNHSIQITRVSGSEPIGGFFLGASFN